VSTVAVDQRVVPTLSDATLFSRTVEVFNLSLQSEQFGVMDSHLDHIIKKPWGHEYRVYADNLYDVWKLCIAPGQATSLHCHARKETALLCLAGRGHVQFLEHGYTVSPGKFFSIGKGVFHATTNIGEEDLHLVEVELPRNKLDLIRSQDAYGRSGGSYEQKQHLDDGYGGNNNPLRHCSHTRGARIRTTCLENTYHFGIYAGSEILRWQPGENLLFLVSLHLINAMQQSIQVFPHHGRAVEQDGLYLTISRAARRTEKERT
jgi:mannose-6-phosphate isomerase-like protein (cupin superfamily)